MNDTLLSPLNASVSAPPAGQSKPAARSPLSRQGRPSRTFADIADEVNAPPEPDGAEKPLPPGGKRRERAEESAALAALSALQAQMNTPVPEEDAIRMETDATATAVDAYEAETVSPDKEVNVPPPIPGELPYPEAFPAPGRDFAVQDGGGDLKIDTAPPEGDGSDAPPIRETTETPAQAVSVETAPAAGGEKELAASFLDMRARLAALSHDVTRRTSEEAAPEAFELSEPPLAEIGPPFGGQARETVASLAGEQPDDASDFSRRGAQPSLLARGAEPRRGLAGPRENREGLVALAQTVEAGKAVEAVPYEESVTPSRIIRQIVETTAVSQTGEISQIRLQLNPAFLGRVSIVLTTGTDGLSARIQTQSDAVRDMLSANLFKLQSDLRDMGVNMKSIDIIQAGLTGGAPYGDGGGRSYGRGRDSDAPYGTEPITMARFHHAVRAPMTPSYDDRYTISGDTSVDFRA